MKSTTETLAVLLFLIFVLFFLGHIQCGCAWLGRSSPAAAEAAYGAALLRCVDEAKTLAESKACRARVDAEWRITQTATDGGR